MDALYNLIFDISVILTAILAGIIVAVSGFGIGNLLTPILAIKFGGKVAIAAVALPHLIGTTLRFMFLKTKIDKKIFIYFGITSAIGGLIGALLYWKTTSQALTFIFGIILIFASLMEFSGFLRKIKIGKNTALMGGLLSGFLGGLVGNQGGIRSAALLSFDMDQKAFIATATATAIGLIIDAVRIPIYVVTQYSKITKAWASIFLTIIGVIIGTLLGIKILKIIPKNIFKTVVAILIFLLGILMLFKGV
jgi:uncharacterized membrane protein YfcA